MGSLRHQAPDWGNGRLRLLRLMLFGGLRAAVRRALGLLLIDLRLTRIRIRADRLLFLHRPVAADQAAQAKHRQTKHSDDYLLTHVVLLSRVSRGVIPRHKTYRKPGATWRRSPYLTLKPALGGRRTNAYSVALCDGVPAGGGNPFSWPKR